MRAKAFARSLAAFGFVAFVGAGCGEVSDWLEDVKRHRDGARDAGGGTAGNVGSGGATGAGGSSGGQMCITTQEGGPGSCKPYDVWKQYAYERCQQQKLVLTGLIGGPVCDGGYESLTYTCCPNTVTPPPPPPPPKCGETIDPSGQICKTCWDAVTGKVISNDCVPGTGGTGGSGGSDGNQMCVVIEDGGATSCKDAATWKRYGSAACAQKKLALVDLKFGIPCGTNYSTVSYVCCGAGGSSDPVVTCNSWVNPDGAVCKECRDATGKVVSAGCEGGTVPPNEICDVKTNADGSQCKTCYYSDGTTVSSCPPSP